MLVLIGIVVVFLLVQLLLLGSAVAVAFCLRWCFPDLNSGVGILLGMLSTIVSVYVIVQSVKLTQMARWVEPPEDDDELWDEEDDWDDEDDDTSNDTLPDIRAARPLTPKERRQRSKGNQR
jgi:hypothetical protein